ncbi:hypothetical protein IZ6_18050 [Terrihabitans soli]|uniref:Thyroglobulin type-1 domain-containing protein n=2 Tax=Terrihabitans soli TaxID=708113 RepID=A0A6S6QVM7_9HYPH|nr:hypothetical protein IZ6_18050 [Terrihabitans soli]
MRIAAFTAALLLAAGFGTLAHAQNMEPTIYSDGASCPGDCDSHVVLHPERNGTSVAFDPASSRSNPRRCTKGEMCRICFSAADSSCLTVRYRGGGPPRNKFDFTPAFYDVFCPQPGLPEPLKRKCAGLKANSDSMLRTRVYCLATPDHPGCAEIISAAKDKKTADQPDWDRCRQIGEPAFNREQGANRKRQRSEGCSYEKAGTGGPNSNGVTWRRLLPAVCTKDNTYVGRDGLDCCDSSLMTLGGLGKECTPFLVPK